MTTFFRSIFKCLEQEWKNLSVFIILCYIFLIHVHMYKDCDMLFTSEIRVFDVTNFYDGQKLLSEICSILTDITPYCPH